MEALDDARYHHFKAQMNSSARSGIKALPATLAAMFDEVVAWVDPDGDIKATSGSAFALSTETIDAKNKKNKKKKSKASADSSEMSAINSTSTSKPKSDRKPTRPCYWCGKPVHFDRDCPMCLSLKAKNEKKQSSGVSFESRTVAAIFSKVIVDTDGEILQQSNIAEVPLISGGSKQDEVKVLANRVNSYEDDEIILDSGAQVSVFRNRDLLDNLRPASSTLQVSGVTNGSFSTNMIVDLNNFKDIYYSSLCKRTVSHFRRQKRMYHILMTLLVTTLFLWLPQASSTYLKVKETFMFFRVTDL
jgi:hypothetical protein